MAHYVKRPVVVEAIQFTRGNFDEIEAFCGGDAELRNGKLVVATLEGALTASDGDWIIKGTAGEFYPCKPNIFAEIYEPATLTPEEVGRRLYERSGELEAAVVNPFVVQAAKHLRRSRLERSGASNAFDPDVEPSVAELLDATALLAFARKI